MKTVDKLVYPYLYGGSYMIAQLKNFVVDRLDLEEMFALSALGKLVRSEYQNRSMPVPEWLTDQLAVLEREILARRRDELEKRLEEVKASQSGLETPAEKRERLAREREELEKQLGVAAEVKV
jgi:hypothetical protein